MWEILSTILNILLGTGTLYLYLENHKLKGYEIEKEIKLKKIEIEELKRLLPKKKEEINEKIASRGLIFSGNRVKAEVDLWIEYRNKLNRLNVELEHLEKLKKYRWIFSK